MNSPLVTYTKISPNRSYPRKMAIDRITVHCTVGQMSVETLGAVFARPQRQASSNYGIGPDGRIGLYVDEGDRSWCSSSAENDNRAVTIEVASDAKHPYAVTDEALAATIALCEDICRRNGKKKLLWFGDKNKTLAYKPAADEMVMTVHRWFANKVCPGDYLYSKHGYIAQEVTRRLQEDDEVITDRKLKNKDTGEIVTVKGILKNGQNYIRLADLGDMQVLDVSYDAVNNLAEVGRKRCCLLDPVTH